MTDVKTDENLWGDLPGTDGFISPVAVLREQGEVLTQISNGLLEGRVSSETQGTLFRHYLQITAPSLGYTASILHLRHDPLLYPVIVDPLSGEMSRCETTEELKLALRTALQSEPVRKLIRGLLIQLQ